MKAQSYTIHAPESLRLLMKQKGFHGRVLTHENKGKKYPYSSERQRRYGDKNDVSRSS